MLEVITIRGSELYMRRLGLAILVLLVLSLMVSPVLAQLRQPTELRLIPESFVVISEGEVALTAILTSKGQPLAGKTIVFSATIGTVSPQVGVTDSDGKVSIIYRAPATPVKITVTIMAMFPGDLRFEGSSVTSSGVIEAASSEVSVVGASFPIPETLKDDVVSFYETILMDALRKLPISLPSEAFLLATADNLYVVFAERSDKGLAKVEGLLLPMYMKLAGMNVNVVIAKQVSFEKEGLPATISEILANPDDYKFKLVKISAYRRQVSILYDPDEPLHIEFPITIGYLTEKALEPLAIVSKVLEKVKDVIFKVNEKLVKDFLEIEKDQGLWIFNFEYEHWYDAQAVTNGIVIPLDHPVFMLFERSMQILGGLLRVGGRVLLYDVKTHLPYEIVPSVIELKNNSGRYLGKVVKLTANCYGGYISVQEVIEHNTPCNEDRVYVPDVGCINLVIDVRLEGFIAWNNVSVPPKREELLQVVGVSSFHQDEQFVKDSGSFELIGKVISTKEVSDSLPEGVAIIIYDARKVGELDFEKLAVQVKDEVKDRVGELYWILQDIYPYQKVPEIPFKPPRVVYWPRAPIFVATPRELPEIVIEKSVTVVIDVADTPINLSISNSLVSNVYIKLKEVARNITIYLEKLMEKPPEVPEPPGLVYAYHKIDVSVPEGLIEKANITFWVLKEHLATYKVTKDNVVMLRYHDNKWLKLPTKVVGENTTHFNFTAETPGFSIFAVAIVKIPTSLTITVEPEEVTVEEEVTVKGSMSPAMSKPIELVIKRPDGTTSTQTITSASDGSFSFRVKLDKEGEWSFVARFAGDQAYEESRSNEIKARAKSKPSPCLIATAAFGTEMSSHVQHLRNFRDNMVLKTFAGSNFMTVFNAWYYFWSPYIASAMRACEPLRQTVKYTLYPLMGILYVSEAVYKTLSFNPEIGVTMAGITASFLIGITYFVLPSIAVMYFVRKWPSIRAVKSIVIAWLVALAGTFASIAAQSAIAAMIFTPILVLASIAMAVLLTVQLMKRHLMRSKP